MLIPKDLLPTDASASFRFSLLIPSFPFWYIPRTPLDIAGTPLDGDAAESVGEHLGVAASRVVDAQKRKSLRGPEAERDSVHQQYTTLLTYE